MSQVRPPFEFSFVSTSFLKSLAIQGFAAIAAARVIHGEIF
jgi:hypothetical protein